MFNSEVMDDVVLLFSDARGIYIPRDASELKNLVYLDGTPKDEELEDTLSALSSPEDMYYWETWDWFMTNIGVYKENADGTKEIYFLYQDGDLWAINQKKFDALSPEDKEKFWGCEY